MSKQHGEEGAGRPHFSAECSQSCFLASHVESMMESGGALCSYEILNLLSPFTMQTDHLQASVACSEPRVQIIPQQHAHKHSHVCITRKYTHQCLYGLHMLTVMDVNSTKH